jgi:hypothetical protein
MDCIALRTNTHTHESPTPAMDCIALRANTHKPTALKGYHTAQSMKGPHAASRRQENLPFCSADNENYKKWETWARYFLTLAKRALFVLVLGSARP